MENDKKMNEIVAKRLAVIRHLFEKGKSLSLEGEPINGLCLLPFHDSVEMFMKLCADENGIKINRDTKFADYFELLPTLQDKTQMMSLNVRRVSLKHHGQMPSSLDVEMTRVNVIDFFAHNTPCFFGCNLEDVSLEVLIPFPKVREYLQTYHDFIDKGNYSDAQGQCQIAFRVLMIDYHNKYDRTFDFKAGPTSELEYLRSPNLEKNTDDYLETLKEAVYGLNEAISVMSLGINYYRYREFIALGPQIYRSFNYEESFQYFIGNSSMYNEETAKACYDFVVETALQLQGKNVFLI